MDKSILHLLLASCWLPVSFQVQTEVLVINHEVLGDLIPQWPQNIKHNGSVVLWSFYMAKLLTKLKYSLITVPSAQHPQWQPSGFRLLVKVPGHNAPSIRTWTSSLGVSLDNTSRIWLFYNNSNGSFRNLFLEKSNNFLSNLQYEQQFHK